MRAGRGLAVQLPLWLLRCYFGWEIIPADTPNDSSTRTALSLGDIIVGTSLASMVVSAARFTFNEAGYPNAETWMAWSTAAPIIAGINLASLPLIVFYGLWMNRLKTGVWLRWGYTIVATFVVLLITVRVNRPSYVSRRELVEIAAFIISLAGTVLATVLLARRRGLRLRTSFDR